MREFNLIALIIPILLPMVVGWLIVRARVLAASDSKVLTSFFLYVAAPALLISVLAREDPIALFEPKYIAATALLMSVQYGLLFFIHRYALKRTPQMSAFAAFTGTKFNAVILGLPVLMAALGHKALGPIIINVVIGYFTILPLTLIIDHAARSVQAGIGGGVAGAVKHALRSALTHPLVIGTVIGLAIAGIDWRLPGWLDIALSGLGASATPTALVAVGMMISGHSLTSRRTEVALMSIFRIVVSPLMAIGLAFLIGLPPVSAIALVVSFSLPTAKMVFALAESCETYCEEAADIIVVTTVSLLAVLPTVLWICEWLWPGTIVRH